PPRAHATRSPDITHLLEHVEVVEAELKPLSIQHAKARLHEQWLGRVHVEAEIHFEAHTVGEAEAHHEVDDPMNDGIGNREHRPATGLEDTKALARDSPRVSNVLERAEHRDAVEARGIQASVGYAATHDRHVSTHAGDGKWVDADSGRHAVAHR